MIIATNKVVAGFNNTGNGYSLTQKLLTTVLLVFLFTSTLTEMKLFQYDKKTWENDETSHTWQLR
ncbi:MAG: hypothetical protein EB127_10865 [Alphaproteobacteria bacterium]|nr:hypothetical protein [Alphaproteobacteria bacterium]